MGGTGLIAMVKISETPESVIYEYWYMDENDKGAMEYMKTSNGFKILKEARQDNLLMFRKVLTKLGVFKEEGLEYPDRTCWAG